MRYKLITVLLAAITAGVARAQPAGLLGGDAIAVAPNPVAAQVAPSDKNMTNTIQPGPAIDEIGSFGLSAIIGEPLDLNMNPRPPDYLAADAGVGASFADPDRIRLEGQAFSQEFDRLRAADHGGPVILGRDSDIRFVESHTYRPGIPAPVGLSYRMPSQRLQFFAEIAPILDATPDNSLGWGGGIGIRFYLGR